MEFVHGLSRDVFAEFNAHCSTDHYTKSPEFGNFKTIDGYNHYLVGVKNNGELVATALVLHKKIPYLFSSYCYVTYGYNMDYKDKVLLSFFNIALSNFCKDELKACFLRVDPNVAFRQHDKDGKLTPNGYHHLWLSENFIEDGFTHLGYNYGYSGNWMSRFTYILDLTPDLNQIQKKIKNFNSHTKKNDLRTIRVIEADKADLKYLYLAQLELAKTQRFVAKPLSYFETLYDVFADKAHLYIAKANLKLAYQNLLDEKERLCKQLTVLTNPARTQETEAGIKALDKELDLMIQHGYNTIEDTVLGAKLIIQINDKVSNVHMYTYKTLPNFRVAFALHSKAIAESKKRNAISYDFEGVSGSLDPKDPYFGIYDFKKSFGGDFIEYAGEFDQVIDPLRYQLFKKIDRLYRRYRRKIYLLFKGW
jgi:lipid II:glycine glycyltransferase (peptidoglycan interpeptide bridge formation enzyme)